MSPDVKLDAYRARPGVPLGTMAPRATSLWQTWQGRTTTVAFLDADAISSIKKSLAALVGLVFYQADTHYPFHMTIQEVDGQVRQCVSGIVDRLQGRLPQYLEFDRALLGSDGGFTLVSSSVPEWLATLRAEVAALARAGGLAPLPLDRQHATVARLLSSAGVPAEQRLHDFVYVLDQTLRQEALRIPIIGSYAGPSPLPGTINPAALGMPA